MLLPEIYITFRGVVRFRMIFLSLNVFITGQRCFGILFCAIFSSVFSSSISSFFNSYRVIRISLMILKS